MKRLTIIFQTVLLGLFVISSINAQQVRSIDGYGNNIIYKEWGAAGTNQLYPATVGFGDYISTPGGSTWPSPRLISNELFVQPTLANDSKSLSAYCWAFGQFIDHDITLVKDNKAEKIQIAVPQGDIFFDPTGSGTASIQISRSASDPLSGTRIDNPRQYPNHITAYIDGSAIYGSDLHRATWLRTLSDGKLKTSTGNLLPWNTLSGEYSDIIDDDAPEMDMPLPNHDRLFVAGDFRANENPFLTGMHTVWVREHNRLCDEIKADHPDWNDEEIYQKARKLVGGQLQAIVYNEWLPQMGIHLPSYLGYDNQVNAGIMNVFSAAAYRYGHTTINSILVRMDNDGNILPEGDLLLRDAFFNPDATMEVGGIEPVLTGMATVVQQEFDCKVVDDLRNFLFGAPGSGGMDLVAINIARGRERGLPDYNTVRARFGLNIIPNFINFSDDQDMNQRLQQVYEDINHVDPWVGMLAENHMDGAIFGETAMTIMSKQFRALRDGDRFYFENDEDLTSEEKEWIESTKLSEVIKRNTTITLLQEDIFKVGGLNTATKDLNNDRNIEFAIYPNPAIDIIFLRIPSNDKEEAILNIFDQSGRLIIAQKMILSEGNNTLTLRLPQNLDSGTYPLTIRTKGKIGIKQMIIQQR